MMGVQGVSSAGNMSKGCSMKNMNNDSNMKSQDGIESKSKGGHVDNNQAKISNQMIGSKINIKV